MILKQAFFLGMGVAFLSACAKIIPPPPEPSLGHLRAEQAPPRGEIPQVVEESPFLPPPQPEPQLEKYTVVVHEVPVKELLFAVARDAAMNVDVDPRIEGLVTLNAVDQTLPQILDRVARQVDIRYEIRDKTIIVSPDEPYFRTYKVDYVNLSRDSTSTSSVATQISTTGGAGVGGEGGGGGGGGGGAYGAGGGNNSTTDVKSTSNHRFWTTLTQNIMAIIGEQPTGGGGAGQLATSRNVIVHPESGIINIRATAKQHEQLQSFIDSVLVNAQRQVLIEATVVEVTLDDKYQAGIDWNTLKSGNLKIEQSTISSVITKGIAGGTLAGAPALAVNYLNPDIPFEVTLKALQEYGRTKVLSSPKLMVLNNQTAMLKVVDNFVYFTIEAQLASTGLSGNIIQSFDTNVHTVPVGFVMAVTPQVNENTSVTMNVRPTISRVTSFVNDPNPALASANVVSQIPQIQVREMESVLKVNSGQIAILGGLMQDTIQRNSSGLPFLMNLPGVGELFKSRDNDYVKTELVIFLRPVVIQAASLDKDLEEYRPFLDHNRYEQFTPRAK